MVKSPNYRAPALEKGLDILELFARETEPLSLVAVSERLGRSKSEIFRMMLTLEARGYIYRAEENDRYQITNSLFMLGLERPPVRSLLEAALPEMHHVAELAWQSCHLVLATDDEIVVIARVDSPGDIGYTVRIGHKRPITHSASGSVLFAFQPEKTQQRWLERLRKTQGFDEAAFLARVATIKSRGYASLRSDRVESVTDISVPLMKDGRAIATMVVPYVDQVPKRASAKAVADSLLSAAAEIATALSSVPALALPLEAASAKPLSRAQKARR